MSIYLTRAPFVKHLHNLAISGFYARDLDADDHAFLERVRERGCVDCGSLAWPCSTTCSYSDQLIGHTVPSDEQVFRPMEQSRDAASDAEFARLCREELEARRSMAERQAAAAERRAQKKAEKAARAEQLRAKAAKRAADKAAREAELERERAAWLAEQERLERERRNRLAQAKQADIEWEKSRREQERQTKREAVRRHNEQLMAAQKECEPGTCAASTCCPIGVCQRLNNALTRLENERQIKHRILMYVRGSHQAWTLEMLSRVTACEDLAFVERCCNELVASGALMGGYR